MTATAKALELTTRAALAAMEKKAENLVAFDVSDKLAITDVFLVISATNERQVGAIVDGIEENFLKHGDKPVRREGDSEKRWVLLDYLDIVIHVMHEEEREFYALERLWKDCPEITLPEDVPPTERSAEAVEAQL